MQAVLLKRLRSYRFGRTSIIASSKSNSIVNPSSSTSITSLSFSSRFFYFQHNNYFMNCTEGLNTSRQLFDLRKYRSCLFSTSTTSQEDNNIHDNNSNKQELGNEHVVGWKEIEQWYKKHHNLSLKHDSVTTICKEYSKSSNGGIRWAAYFTCPITAQRYSSGTIINYKDNKNIQKDNNNGVCWYLNSSDAITAALYKALDYKKYQQNQQQQKNRNHEATIQSQSRYCEELPESIVTNRAMYVQDNFDSLRNQLHRWYSQNHGIQFNQGCFTSTVERLQGDLGGDWWTATFVCPISADRFDAGSLRNSTGDIRIQNGTCWYRRKGTAMTAAACRVLDAINYQVSGTMEPRHCDDVPPKTMSLPVPSTTDDDNVVNKDEPQTTITNESQTTITNESQTTNSEKSPTIGTTSANNTINTMSKQSFPKSNSDGLQQDTTNNVNPPIKKVENKEVDTPDNANTNNNDNNDNNYMAEHHEQQQVNNNTSHTQISNPLDVIMNTWVENPALSLIVSTSPGSSSNIDTTPQKSSSKQRAKMNLEEAIQSAKAWVAKQQEKQNKNTGSQQVQFMHRYDALKLEKVANVMLQSLANAHQCVPFSSEPRGVEEVATAILDLLMASSLDKLDADTFALYIRCLEGENPHIVAQRGQNVINLMRSDSPVNGRLLPEPNTAAINSALYLWAQAGVKLGLEVLDEVATPNRETFLNLLSAMGNAQTEPQSHNSSFDLAYARCCIDRMRRLSEELHDETLRPDRQVYNTPLRCCLGDQSNISSSRPYERVIGWDAYDEIYRQRRHDQSQQPDDDMLPLLQEAQDIESWVKEMEERNEFGISPDIVTYESLIQAWVRTGTIDGLLQAESIAIRLLKIDDRDDMKARLQLQTFHPVIAGMIYSGIEEGCERLRKLIGLLLKQSKKKSKSDLKVDGRILSAPILAYLMRQARLAGLDTNSPINFDRFKADTHKLLSHKEEEEILECAKLAHAHLKEMIGSKNKNKIYADVLLEAGTFTNVIQCWFLAALVAMKSKGSTDAAPMSITAIFETIDNYDSLIQLSYTKYRADNENSMLQLSHLLQSTITVYSTAVSAAAGICQFTQRESMDCTYLTEYVVPLERMARRSLEIQAVLKKGLVRGATGVDIMGVTNGKLSGTAQQCINYDDLYQYPFPSIISHKTLPTSQDKFFKFLLKYLKQCREEDHDYLYFGDIARFQTYLEGVVRG